MTPEQPAITAEGLVKRYGRTVALHGLDLWVGAGTVLGLLGPNGAGKTTAVRILTTLLRPDAGRATVLGLDVVADSDRVRRVIGLSGQYAAVDGNLNAVENLYMIGRLSHLGRATTRARVAELIERFDLSAASRRTAKTYSGGMRRRLDLAAALVAAPPVLVLDEPTTGLDPRARATVWDLVTQLVTDGTTVLLTTQYLEEADRLADSLVLVDHGTVITGGTPQELKTRLGGDRIEVVVTDRDQLPAAVAALTTAGHAAPDIDQRRRCLIVPAPDGARRLAETLRALNHNGVAIETIALRQPTLDEVFLTLTDRPTPATHPQLTRLAGGSR
jgi:ABC-2 type transport system ATP-binding protein